MGNCQAVPGIPVLETVVKTDNSPLTYILTTPNLDATHHHWVKSLAGLTFSIEYQKGRDNTDVLSQIQLKLIAEAVKSILDGVTIGTTERADPDDPMVAEADERIHKQVEETVVHGCVTHMHVNLHVTDWVAVQQVDPILKMWWSRFPPIRCRISNIFWETTPWQKRALPSWGRGEIHTPSECPLSLPYSGWGAGGSSVVCNPHSS